jgi:hypothetical protein
MMISLRKGISCTALLLFALSGGPVARSRSQTLDQRKPIVALARRSGRYVTINIFPNPTAGQDPLRIFNALREQFGPDYPIVAIVDYNGKISDLFEISGTAGKAGLNNIRTFISYPDSGKMAEVKFGLALPFSKDGPFN